MAISTKQDESGALLSATLAVGCPTLIRDGCGMPCRLSKLPPNSSTDLQPYHLCSRDIITLSNLSEHLSSSCQQETSHCRDSKMFHVPSARSVDDRVSDECAGKGLTGEDNRVLWMCRVGGEGGMAAEARQGC